MFSEGFCFKFYKYLFKCELMITQLLSIFKAFQNDKKYNFSLCVSCLFLLGSGSELQNLKYRSKIFKFGATTLLTIAELIGSVADPDDF